MEQIYQHIGKTKDESSQAKEFKIIHITMWGTSKGCYWSRNVQELKIMFRLGLILDLCMLTLTIWKTLISPKGVEKKAISREMELLRLTFTSFAISSCTAAASIFSPWVLRTLCQKKGRPLRSLRHTRRARVLLFVLVHFLWHVFKNVHFFISIFNAQGKEKRL